MLELGADSSSDLYLHITMAGWLRLETKNSDISSQIKYNSKLSTTSLEHKVRSIRRIIKANSFLFLVDGVVLIISTLLNHNVDI